MKRFSSYAALCLLLFFSSACTAVQTSLSNHPSALDPKGPAATHMASLWWVMFSFATGIFLLVIGLIFAAYMRRQRATNETTPDSSDGDTGRRWLIRGGIALPIVVLAIVFGYTTYTLAAVENPHGQVAVHIKVIARRWWWQVQYPDQGFETANEIHIPTGVPVQLQLDSPDVIHSFWVPELHGKMDVIPSHTNYITIQADHPGIYRGECAEYCGLQHALMGFVIVAQSSADFNQWLSAQQQDAAAPATPTVSQGQQVFISAGCVYCHTVRGLDEKSIVRASTDLGPDLTHFGSRLSIGGVTLSNNTNNLAGWVVDSQHIKQGIDMPPMSINSQDLQTLIAYLQALH